MEFSSRIDVVKMNIVPRLLYLFQVLPVMIPEIQFRAWDRTIIYNTAASKGGQALPNPLEYFTQHKLGLV